MQGPAVSPGSERRPWGAAGGLRGEQVCTQLRDPSLVSRLHSQEQRAGPAVSGSGLRPSQLLPAEGRQPGPVGRMGKKSEPVGSYFLLLFYSGHSDIALLSASHSRGPGFESRSCCLRAALGPLPNLGFYFHLRPISDGAQDQVPPLEGPSQRSVRAPPLLFLPGPGDDGGAAGQVPGGVL